MINKEMPFYSHLIKLYLQLDMLQNMICCKIWSNRNVGTLLWEHRVI